MGHIYAKGKRAINRRKDELLQCESWLSERCKAIVPPKQLIKNPLANARKTEHRRSDTSTHLPRGDISNPSRDALDVTNAYGTACRETANVCE